MTPNPSSRTKQRLAAAGIAVGATIGSFAAASALSSNDDTSDATGAAAVAAATTADETDSPSAVTDDDAADDDADRGMGLEEPLTGDLAVQVTAAAEAAVPGGTVERVETDAQGAAYEAHMLDADGNPVTVTFDENLAVVETITGGPGGPGHGGPGRHGHHDGDEANESATDTDTTTDG